MRVPGSSREQSRGRSSSLRAELHPIVGIDEHTRAAWADLERTAVEPNPFFGPDMATAAATHLPRGTRDELLVVRRGDDLELALPLRRTRRYRQVPIPTFRAWGHDHTFLDTPLIGGRDPEGAWDVALGHLGARGAGWLTFERLRADGPARASLDAALQATGVAPRTLTRADRPMVRRRAAPTYLDERLSSSQRRRLGRFRRRLEAALGGPVWVADRAQGDLEAAVDRFLTLEVCGWKGQTGTALASSPGGAEFFRHSMRAAGRTGRAQMWELGVGGTVVAALSAVVGGDGCFHLKTAYDERYRKCSPGLLLEVEVLGAFHGDRALGWIDSCVTGGAESPSARLYPDRSEVECLVVPLRGRPTQAAATGLQQAIAWKASRAARTD